MTEISRRELLGSAALTGGGLAAASLWPALPSASARHG